MESKDAKGHFEDPDSKKQCWKSDDVRFDKLGLSWSEAMITLMAVYSDYPLLFFTDPYKTGGDPNGGYITPIIDAECSRGDFRRFYAEKIETDIKAAVSGLDITMTCREAAYKLYKHISENAEYDNSKADGNRISYVDVPSHSILNYVRNRSGACEGFARAYQAILNFISIPAVYISVNYDNGSHACNFVYLADEKKWIMVDITHGVCQNDDWGFDVPVGIYGKMRRGQKSDEYHSHMPEHNYVWSRYREG